MADDADELIEMTKRAATENAELIRRRAQTADQSAPRLWSNQQLNEWLTQALATEREEIRKRTVNGMTNSTSQLYGTINTVVESLSERITKTRNDVQTIVDTIAETFNAQQKTIEALEAEIAAMKAAQNKKGWW